MEKTALSPWYSYRMVHSGGQHVHSPSGQKTEVGTQWCQASALVKFLCFVVCDAGFEPRTLFILGQPSSAELHPQILYYLGVRPWEVAFSVSSGDLGLLTDFTQCHISSVAEGILDTPVPEAPDINKHKFFSGKNHVFMGDLIYFYSFQNSV